MNPTARLPRTFLPVSWTALLPCPDRPLVNGFFWVVLGSRMVVASGLLSASAASSRPSTQPSYHDTSSCDGSTVSSPRCVSVFTKQATLEFVVIHVVLVCAIRGLQVLRRLADPLLGEREYESLLQEEGEAAEARRKKKQDKGNAR